MPIGFGCVPRIFLFVLEAGNNGRSFRVGANPAKFGVGIGMETMIFVLDVQICWQIHFFKLVQRNPRIHRC